ncbi:MAG: glutamate--tRNA ligase [Anaerolineales bacterium]|jgi:glutamyl-tRNA synthetase
MENERDNQPARVRFAPSPTGLTHIGSARTALYNYLLARQTGGQFILRFEDTDQKRYDPYAEEDLITTLKWLGLEWDEGPDIGGPYTPYRQSERKEKYLDYARELIEKGHAFYCFCTREELDKVRKEQQKNKEIPQYRGPCRNLPLDQALARVESGEEHVVRFKMPKEGITTVHDRLRGDIVFENSNLDDFIIVKSDGLALYHLAAMADDHDMKVTHVFRGAEWLPTFPLHARIYRALGWEEPEWVHLSLFLKPSGKGKMSKRDTDQMRLTGESIFVKDMKELGYLPEGVVNWIALMGWSYDDHTEFFTMEDLISKFSIDKLNPSNSAIDFKKFDHFNGLHIRNLTVRELTKRIIPFFEKEGIKWDEEKLLKITPLIQERLVTLDEAPTWAGFFFQENVHPEPEELIAKGLSEEESLDAAQQAYAVIKNVEDFNRETIEPPLRLLVDEMELKPGQLFGILRIAVTGQKVSPPLFESMEIIGRDVVLSRIEQGMELLENYIEKS